MLFPSKLGSTVEVGDRYGAEFNLIWYTPGSKVLPSEYDILVMVASEITDVFRTKQSEHNTYGVYGESSLGRFLNLTERVFGIVVDL